MEDAGASFVGSAPKLDESRQAEPVELPGESPSSDSPKRPAHAPGSRPRTAPIGRCRAFAQCVLHCVGLALLAALLYVSVPCVVAYVREKPSFNLCFGACNATAERDERISRLEKVIAQKKAETAEAVAQLQNVMQALKQIDWLSLAGRTSDGPTPPKPVETAQKPAESENHVDADEIDWMAQLDDTEIQHP